MAGAPRETVFEPFGEPGVQQELVLGPIEPKRAVWRQRWGERGGHFLRVSLPWTLLGLHYHGIAAASRDVAEKFTRTGTRNFGL